MITIQTQGMRLVSKYYLSLALIFSLLIIYACMLVDKNETFRPFLFLETEVRERYYFYTIGSYLSYAVLSFVIFKLSDRLLKWTALILTAYWIAITIDFIGWYNTTYKGYYWIVLTALFVGGIIYNDKGRIRGKGKRT